MPSSRSWTSTTSAWRASGAWTWSGSGAIVQRPLAAVIARPGVGARPRDLEGRRVGVTGLPSDEAVLRAVVEDDGGDYDRVRKVTIGFSAVPSLVAGRVDAVVVVLERRGRRAAAPRACRRASSASTTSARRATRSSCSRRCARRSSGTPTWPAGVLAALEDGTEAALRDRATAAIDRIARASGADRDLVSAQLEAIAPALRPALRLDRSALEDWARFDAEFGILRSRPDVDEAFALGAPG